MSFEVFSLLIKTSILCVLSPCKLLATTGLFIVSIVLPFPEWNIVRTYFFLSHKGTNPLQDHSWCTHATRQALSGKFPHLTLPILSPVPLAPPSSHVEGQRETCWIFVRRKPTNFVPLVTMNPDSC